MISSRSYTGWLKCIFKIFLLFLSFISRFFYFHMSAWFFYFLRRMIFSWAYFTGIISLGFESLSSWTKKLIFLRFFILFSFIKIIRARPRWFITIAHHLPNLNFNWISSFVDNLIKTRFDWIWSKKWWNSVFPIFLLLLINFLYNLRLVFQPDLLFGFSFESLSLI